MTIKLYVITSPGNDKGSEYYKNRIMEIANERKYDDIEVVEQHIETNDELFEFGINVSYRREFILLEPTDLSLDYMDEYPRTFHNAEKNQTAQVVVDEIERRFYGAKHEHIYLVGYGELVGREIFDRLIEIGYEITVRRSTPMKKRFEGDIIINASSQKANFGDYSINPNKALYDIAGNMKSHEWRFRDKYISSRDIGERTTRMMLDGVLKRNKK